MNKVDLVSNMQSLRQPSAEPLFASIMEFQTLQRMETENGVAGNKTVMGYLETVTGSNNTEYDKVLRTIDKAWG